MPKRNKKSKQAPPLPVILDIETGDYDDILTVLVAVTHPRLEVKAITVTPGSLDQIRLVQYLLVQKLDCSRSTVSQIRFGAQEWPKNRAKKGSVNLKSYAKLLAVNVKELERFAVVAEDSIFPAAHVIVETCRLFPEATIFTGGPLHNLAAALQHDDNNDGTLSSSSQAPLQIQRWVAQGGFCGENVLPDHVQQPLQQFQGQTHISTWNFGGSREATLTALSSAKIERRVLVGKNTCHQCIWDAEMDRQITEARASAGAQKRTGSMSGEKVKALELFQKITKPGKKLHDVLALATLIDEDVCEFVEVQVTVTKDNKWGSILQEGSGTFGAVDFSPRRFIEAIKEEE